MEKVKPKVRLTSQNGNVFNLLAVCTRALKSEGQIDEASELTEKVFEASSYNEALQIMKRYCEIN